MNQKAIKGQSLADQLSENLVDDLNEPLTTYFPHEEAFFEKESISETYNRWRIFFDGVVNSIGSRIGVVLISESVQNYPSKTNLRFGCTNIMAKYEDCILGIRISLEMNDKELVIIGD